MTPATPDTRTYTSRGGEVLGFTTRELLAELESEEARHVLPALSHADAARLGGILARLAGERALPVVVRVALVTGDGLHTVFQQAFSGSSLTNDWWLDRKTAAAQHFGAASFAVGTRFRVDGTTFEESSGLPDDEFKAHGGVVPLRVGERIVGYAGVSGLPQQDDHALVVEAIEELLASV